MICKAWAYTKYYFFKLNRKYDDMKEPYRFLTALAIVTPWIWLMKIGEYKVSIAYMLVLVFLRVIWHSWAEFKMKGK